MKNSYVRIIVTVLVLLVLVLLATYLFTTEFTMFGFSTKTIAGFKDTIDQYTKSEQTYNDSIVQQKSKIAELRKTENSYEEIKKKYENLTDDTINVVKEANKTEKYSIEYLWIRLGDYAKKHNVEIMIVDSESTVVAPKDETSTDADGNATTDANGNPVENATTETDKNNTNNSKDMQPQANILKVQVIGSYMNIADYIYVIENDSTLRFKLDNIKMESAGDGNKVKVSFGVKNLQIVK